MKSLRPTILRHRHEQLSYRLRTWLLALSGFIILVSLIMAVVLFGYIFNLALNPEVAEELIDRWSQVFLNNSAAGLLNLPTLAGPARWFAVFTLGILAFILTRIPLLLLQMGTQIFMASTHEQRMIQDILRTLLREMRQESQSMNSENSDAAPGSRFSSRTSSDQEYP